jgi:preprotein translocase subunit SecA
VTRIESHVASQRRELPERVFGDPDAKWRAVVDRVADVHTTGRPILVGTSGVAASEHLSRLLTVAGLPHRTLNARQDRAEADIVARAGERGRITVATNMAGRGTDIRLGTGVAALGGLHVIVTERHEAARIDRQLIGRAARQGDPGSFEMLLSLEDPVVEHARGWLFARLARQCVAWTLKLSSRPAAAFIRAAQRSTERAHAALRRRLLRSDRAQHRRLAFSGSGE